jgi:hypothetical protein
VEMAPEHGPDGRNGPRDQLDERTSST